MLTGLSDNDLAVEPPFVDAAFQRLVYRLEQALGHDDIGVASAAYERYAECWLGVLSGTVSGRELSEAGEQLVDVLRRLVTRSDVRGEVDDAAADYVQDLAAACAELDVPGLEDITSMATATTLLAVLYGVDRLGSNQLNAMVAGASSPWSRSVDDRTGWPGDEQEEDEMSDGVDTSSSADDEIVWQEFAVGDDGQIVERTRDDIAPVPRHVANGDGPRQLDDDQGRRGDERERARGTGDRKRRPTRSSVGDPVALVEEAARSYLTGLAAAGITIDRIPDAGREAAASWADLERHGADLTASYLRTSSGVGNLPDLYGSYARLLASIARLVEHHLDQVRQYEQLGSLNRLDPRDRVRSAERLYERFLASTRDAWSRVDPAGLSLDELASMNRATAQTASVHEAVTGRRQRTRER